MCGRYAINTEDEIIEIREILKEISKRITEDKFKNYDKFGSDAYPGVTAPIITPDNKLTKGIWGFEKWDGKGIIFNARSEGLIASRFFSKHISDGRCIVPAKSYYEWYKSDIDKKIKYSIYDSANKPLYMAGLMKNDSAGNISYVVITKAANDNIKFIHDRMPLLLTENEAVSWISPEFISKLLLSDSVRVDYKLV